MTLTAAPHPASVFLYLKQAWRDYIATGGAQTLTVPVVPGQAASAPLTVSGTVLVDTSIDPPVPVTVTLTQSATVKGTQTVNANATTGAWTATFPGGTLVAGTATATATTPYGAPVTTAAFTLT
jgi:hypothetical protein